MVTTDERWGSALRATIEDAREELLRKGAHRQTRTAEIQPEARGGTQMSEPRDIEIESQVLRTMIQDVTADLPRVATKIKTAWSFSLHRGSRRDLSRVATEHYRELGVLLHGGPTELATPEGSVGAYGGAALYLLTGGRLLRLRYWGGWDEHHARWRSRAQLVTIRAAVSEFPLRECVRAIELAFDQPEARR